MKDKKLIAAALLLPITVFFSGAALALSQKTAEISGSAPSVQEIEAETYVGIAIDIELSAVDSADDVVLYQITEQPRLGTAVINGGVLHYTPGQRTGKDKFSYTAVDAEGYTAVPATVTVRVEKNEANRTYADMEGNPAHYAALRLSAEGVMTGESISGCSFFRPAQTVTRSEFIAMVASAAELPVKPTGRTDFADDSGLSDWAKPFVSTAAANGLVNGYQTASGSAEIRGQNPITFGEASVIVNNLLASSMDEVQYTVSMEGVMDMDWAQDAIGRLEKMDVIRPEAASQPDSTLLNRQDACELLYRAIRLMHN